MITAKAWPLVPSDRPGEFRPSCWAWAREALQQAFSPASKPLPSVCCFSDGPGPLANWTWRSWKETMMDTQGKINSFNPTGKHLYKTKTPATSTMRRPPVERSDTPSIGDGFSSRGPRMEPPSVIQSPTRYRGGQRKWPAQVASSTLPDSQISIQPHGDWLCL